MTYDLVVKGGTVIDPAQSIHGRRDVALTGGKVAAVADAIPASEAVRVIDVGNRIVTPGLIDLHTHLYKGVSELGIDVDECCLPSGVTTSVDAGTAGSVTFPAFRDNCVRKARSRVYAFVNIASIGIIIDRISELHDMLYVDPEGVAATIAANPDICLGIKLRVGEDQLGDLGFKPIKICLEAAERIQCPVMVHISIPAVPLSELFDMLKPGDIITHVFHGRSETVVQGEKVLPALWRAQQRGVRTDIGHGKGSFSFATARAALADGFRPDTISTDLHAFSIKGPVYDLATTMSKFLELGMSLDEVVAATTINAARTIRKDHDIGSLKPGLAGDVAVFDLLEGEFTFVDSQRVTIRGSRRLMPVLTVFGGEIVTSRLEGLDLPPTRSSIRVDGRQEEEAMA